MFLLFLLQMIINMLLIMLTIVEYQIFMMFLKVNGYTIKQ